MSQKSSSPHLYILILFLLGIFLYFVRLRELSIKNSGIIKTNQQIKIYAVINSVIQKKDGQKTFKMGQFFIKTNNDYNFFYGQRLKIVGTPQIKVINPFYSQFWLINPEIYFYESLTSRDKERFRDSNYMIQSLRRSLTNSLAKIRQQTKSIFYQILPSPNSDLISGIVLGSQERFDNTLYQALVKTGTLHIVAASGMNVTLIAKILIDSLIIFISRKKAYFVSLVAILIYCLLAGGGPAVVRAGLMAGLTLLGLAWGREAQAGWLLFLTGSIMLLVNPFLLFDTGFQLSFAAMAGMIFIKPKLNNLFLLAYHNLGIAFRIKLAKKPDSVNNSLGRSHCKSSLNWVSSLLSSNLLDTLSAQIATFPILYFTFGQVQPLSFLPNLFVLPLVPLIMMMGFIILILGLIYLPLSYPVAYLAWPVLTYFVKVIEWWGKVL